MLDLETMGTSGNAAILAIGAVQFCPIEGKIGEKFYVTVDLESAVQMGGIIDAPTVLWWLQQSAEARAPFAKQGEHINVALADFHNWVKSLVDDTKVIQMWGNASTFDNVILQSAYQRSCITLPWKFWGDRCYRTMKNLFPEIKLKRVGTGHNAVDDAESQALHLIEIYKRVINGPGELS
jgi:exodeoxyribonuclease VIII